MQALPLGTRISTDGSGREYLDRKEDPITDLTQPLERGMQAFDSSILVSSPTEALERRHERAPDRQRRSVVQFKAGGLVLTQEASPRWAARRAVGKRLIVGAWT